MALSQSLAFVVAKVDSFIKDISITFQLITEQQLHAQNRMKWFVDKHQTEHSFQVGDMVYLCLQLYR